MTETALLFLKCVSFARQTHLYGFLFRCTFLKKKKRGISILESSSMQAKTSFSPIFFLQCAVLALLPFFLFLTLPLDFLFF
jgi:hypothetical protein